MFHHRSLFTNGIRPIIFNEHLSPLLSSAIQYSDLLVERAVVGLLRLCPVLALKVNFKMISFYSSKRLIHFWLQPPLRDQIYVAFDLVAGLPPSVAASVAPQVIAGVSHLVQKHQHVIRSVPQHYPIA